MRKELKIINNQEAKVQKYAFIANYFPFFIAFSEFLTLSLVITGTSQHSFVVSKLFRGLLSLS